MPEEIVVEKKKFYESKSFWLFLIGIIYGGYQLISSSFTIEPGSTVPQGTMETILSVLGMVLRFITKKPISW